MRDMGIIILVAGFATPLLLTAVGYLPFMSSITDKVRPYIAWQSLIGTYRVRPLEYLIGITPSIGHASYIAFMIILNVILTAVNYKSAQPNGWFSSQYQKILEYIIIRTGTLGFALAPLVILFAGRIQPLALYVNNGTDSEELNLPYWIWGCVATVAVVIMLVASNFYRKFGYEVWLYAACTVWFFDRMMHMLPVLKNGMRRFNIVNIDDDVVRVDIHGIRWAAGPGQHVYVYFPTLNRLRSWENHPFSFDAIHTEVNWADESLDDK
ncbi:hypothetical protein BN1723_014235, partial [Verticillium longisporum]